MFGSQSAWYFQHLAGIQLTNGTRGFEDLTFQPQVSLNWKEEGRVGGAEWARIRQREGVSEKEKGTVCVRERNKMRACMCEREELRARDRERYAENDSASAGRKIETSCRGEREKVEQNEKPRDTNTSEMACVQEEPL